MLEVCHADGSACAQKVRLVVFEKGLDWVDRRMNLDLGTHYEPWYVTLNPKAVVPTLVQDGKGVWPEAKAALEKAAREAVAA